MKRMAFCIVLLLAATCNTQAQTEKVDSRSHLERAKELCSKLTLEEKVRLMEHESPAIERLGIRQWDGFSHNHGIGIYL